MLRPVLPKIFLPNSACAMVAWKMIVAGTKLWAHSPTINQDQGFPLANEHSARTSFVFHSLNTSSKKSFQKQHGPYSPFTRWKRCCLQLAGWFLCSFRQPWFVTDLRPQTHATAQAVHQQSQRQASGDSPLCCPLWGTTRCKACYLGSKDMLAT